MAYYHKKSKFEKVSENKYKAVDEDYDFDTIIFTISEEDIKVKFMMKYKNKIINQKYECIGDYKNKTALDTIRKHNGKLGRHFDEGVIKIYHGLGLPLGYVVPILREWRKQK